MYVSSHSKIPLAGFSSLSQWKPSSQANSVISLLHFLCWQVVTSMLSSPHRKIHLQNLFEKLIAKVLLNTTYFVPSCIWLEMEDTAGEQTHSPPLVLPRLWQKHPLLLMSVSHSPPIQVCSTVLKSHCEIQNVPSSYPLAVFSG